MDKNEILFWKLIHNGYLFKKITRSIGEVIDTVLYNNCLAYGYQCYSIENRDKFKYIHSLSWMVNNGQFELLKWKLQSGQYIQINLDSLQVLVENYPLQSNIFSILLEKKRTLIGCLCDDLNEFITEHSNNSNVKEYLLNQIKSPYSSTPPIETITDITNKLQDHKFNIDDDGDEVALIKRFTKVGSGNMELPLFNQYSNAVETCDTDKIKQLESIPINLAPYSLSESFYKLFNNNSIQQIEQLTNYWYTNNYNKFSQLTYTEFMERVIYQQRNRSGGGGCFSNIKLNLNQNDNTIFQRAILSMLIELILINDFKSISLFFNLHSFKLERNHFDLFVSIWNNTYSEPKYLFDKQLNVYTNNFTCNEIIEMVNFWIAQYNTLCGGGGTDETLIESFSIIFNYLYSTFSQIKMVGLQDILGIRRLLIEECGINIHHSEFHSFNYLFIKSPLLVKYILGTKEISNWCHYNLNYYIIEKQIFNQEIESLRHNVNQNLYNCAVYNPNNPLSIFQLDKLTFESVFGDDGKTFEELVLQLLLTNKNTDHLFGNNEIEYLLDINKLDILFKQFDSLVFSIRESPSEKLLEFAFKSLNSSNVKTMLLYYIEDNDIDQWFRCCSIYENRHIIKYLFDNNNLYGKWDIIFSNDLQDLNLVSIKYIFSNYHQSFHPTADTNIFIKSLIQGNIELCDLLLKYYPNHFKITDQVISTAINKSKFNIVQYYKYKK